MKEEWRGLQPLKVFAANWRCLCQKGYQFWGGKKIKDWISAGGGHDLLLFLLFKWLFYIELFCFSLHFLKFFICIDVSIRNLSFYYTKMSFRMKRFIHFIKMFFAIMKGKIIAYLFSKSLRARSPKKWKLTHYLHTFTQVVSNLNEFLFSVE